MGDVLTPTSAPSSDRCCRRPPSDWARPLCSQLHSTLGETLKVIGDEPISVVARTPTCYIAIAGPGDFGPATVGSGRRCLTYGGRVSPLAVDAWADATPQSVWGPIGGRHS